jgi:hypothetical protein
LVIVEPFILGSCDPRPGAVLTLGQGVLSATQKIEHDALGLGRDDTGADTPFRVDLGILFAGLVQNRWLEILHHRFVDLGQGREPGQEGET